MSPVLSANNVGRLGNVERLPSAQEIDETRNSLTVAGAFTRFENDELIHEIHRLAKIELERGEVDKALRILCTLHG
jgi:predicted negative regulator of RcsB-dependent stress response